VDLRRLKYLWITRLCNPPYGSPADLHALARMSDRQIMYLYMATDRDEQGQPKFTMPDAPRMSDRQIYERYLFLNGIHDPEIVERLWAERCLAEKVKRA
jgi:hypothetical protein